MGPPVYFCAGADINNLPVPPVDGLLINALDHGSAPEKIEAAKKMCHRAKLSRLMADSSGYQILKAEEKGKAITFDPSQPMSRRALGSSSRSLRRGLALLNPWWKIAPLTGKPAMGAIMLA